MIAVKLLKMDNFETPYDVEAEFIECTVGQLMLASPANVYEVQVINEI